MSLNGHRVFPQQIQKNKEENSYISEFLKNGEIFNMNGDYSVGVTDFIFTATKKTKINRLLLYIKDNGTMNYDTYGSIQKLTNGVRVFYQQQLNSKKYYIDGGYSIQSNGNWSKRCYDTNIKSTGSGNNLFSARWTFSESGTSIYLNIGGTIGVELRDDMNGTGLIEHKIIVQGYSFN
jgi:hypothetical protein